MFYYVIRLYGDSWENLTEEDVRITDDRGMAEVAMIMLHLAVKVIAKPI